MAYKKTGDPGNGGGSVPTDMDDFIFSKWGPFSEDQGYVSNQAPSPGSAPNREYWTHRSGPTGPFCYMRTRDEALFMMTGLGIDTGEEIFDQPDNPSNGPDNIAFNAPGTSISTNTACPIVNNANGPWAGHWLFSNAAGDYIHAVARISSKVFRHFWYGVMPAANKYGTFTGGAYCFGNFWNQTAGEISDPHSLSHFGPGTRGSTNAAGRPQKCGFVHVEGLTGGVKWYIPTPAHSLGNSYTVSKVVGNVNNSSYAVGEAQMLGWANSFGGGPWRWGPSLIARGLPLIPITVACSFTYAGNNGFGIVGTIPDVFYINMREFSPGEEIVLGSDTYVVFPITNNDTVTTVNGEEYSGYYGLAYKVIP